LLQGVQKRREEGREGARERKKEGGREREKGGSRERSNKRGREAWEEREREIFLDIVCMYLIDGKIIGVPRLTGNFTGGYKLTICGCKPQL